MNFIKLLIALILVIMLTDNAKAQFSLSGEFRPRTEFNKGYKTLASEGQDLSTFTTQRTRINAAFKNEFVNTKLVLQDVRLWGGQAQLVQNEDYAVSVHEAWAEILFTKELKLKAGRQEVVYDDQRIFGNVGWAQQGRSHDMAILKLEKEFSLHFGIAHNENSNTTNNLYEGPDAYKDLQFVWFNKKWERTSLSLLVLNNGVPVIENNEQVNKYSQTIGGHVSTKFSELVVFNGNLYYQAGKHTSGKDISALNLLAELGFKNFTLGYEYLSGNDYNETKKYKSFNPLYGTNHKFNGFMDYFYVGNHIGSVGLNDIYLKYQHQIKKIGFNADLHYFTAAAKVAENADSYLGTELDLSASWAINPITKLTFGYSRMFAGESMEIIKGGNHSESQQWSYLMLSVTPPFIK
ncbi:MAG TPA: alginate export family protein [Draconibacterium sp.]|nr:alginate export family protein [Draconibacterium sp.]